MTNEDVSRIYAWVRKHLFANLRNDFADDAAQYICLRYLENPKIDFRFALVDFCRLNGITSNRPKKDSSILRMSKPFIDLISPEQKEYINIFDEISERLTKMGVTPEYVREAVGLFENRDFSGVGNLFRRIGMSQKADYPSQRWENADKMYRLGNKIIKYLREYDKCGLKNG